MNELVVFEVELFQAEKDDEAVGEQVEREHSASVRAHAHDLGRHVRIRFVLDLMMHFDGYFAPSPWSCQRSFCMYVCVCVSV